MPTVEDTQPWRSLDYWVERINKNPDLSVGDAMLFRAALHNHRNDPRAKELDQKLKQFLDSIPTANEQVEEFVHKEDVIAPVVEYLKLDSTDIAERNIGIQRMEQAIQGKDPGLMSTLEELEKSIGFPIAAQIRAEREKRRAKRMNRIALFAILAFVLIVGIILASNS